MSLRLSIFFPITGSYFAFVVLFGSINPLIPFVRPTKSRFLVAYRDPALSPPFLGGRR